MDQKRLRELEALCIQEEQPFCTAACPLHVDVRAFMKAMTRHDLRGARKVLDRTLSFPEIIGRVCDQPCRMACKRNEIDAALAIGSLERYCITNTSQVLKPPKLPTKGGTVGVLGSGLSAMTAALDLARKGRSVTLVTDASSLGGTLASYDEEQLPKNTFEKAEVTLQGYGVNLRFSTTLSAESTQEWINTFDAVYIDKDTFNTAQMCSFDCSHPDPVTLAVSQEGCFAGGGSSPGNFSVIQQAEDGRRAASTIERYLQGVSLTAQRDKEGATPTRMYTVITGVSPSPEIVPSATGGYSEEEARLEAGRCIQCQCMECVKQCQFLQEYKEYPKTLVRKIFNNESIVQGTRQANKMINACSLCNQCTVICPNDFPVAEVCLKARENLVNTDHMPPSAHDFAIEDMRFSLSDACSLLKHQPETRSSKYLFFPGCQLSGSSPATVLGTYEHLCAHLDDGVGMMLSCCGIPAHWAGQQEYFAELLDNLCKAVESMGAPQIITACSSCLDIFHTHAPELNVISLWEILDEIPLPTNVQQLPQQQLTIHDPCTSRHQQQVRDHVRSITSKLQLNIQEHDYTGERTDCCGFGGLMQFGNPLLGEKTAQHKAGRSELDGIAYCAMCRDNLAAGGSKTAHLLEYLFHTAGDDPLERANPGFSQRHENRARLKEQCLTNLWQEAPPEQSASHGIKLITSPDIVDLLNRRHILKDDVRMVIFESEKSGNYLTDPGNNHRLACHRPRRVTYWVEYQPQGDAFTIYTAYSHRMALPEQNQ
ncbi:MAG: amine oxidase [Desulfobulbus propionicus]|nr:MAG: amine oxidase [Desulfobulbus propionicus]